MAKMVQVSQCDPDLEMLLSEEELIEHQQVAESAGCSKSPAFVFACPYKTTVTAYDWIDHCLGSNHSGWIGAQIKLIRFGHSVIRMEVIKSGNFTPVMGFHKTGDIRVWCPESPVALLGYGSVEWLVKSWLHFFKTSWSVSKVAGTQWHIGNSTESKAFLCCGAGHKNGFREAVILHPMFTEGS